MESVVNENIAPSFVGRNRELAHIHTLFANPKCRLLTLVGAGGIGKTRLSLQVATDLVSSFENGVCFVPLASVASTDLLALAFIGALQLTSFDSDDPRAQVIISHRAGCIARMIQRVRLAKHMGTIFETSIKRNRAVTIPRCESVID